MESKVGIEGLNDRLVNIMEDLKITYASDWQLNESFNNVIEFHYDVIQGCINDIPQCNSRIVCGLQHYEELLKRTFELKLIKSWEEKHLHFEYTHTMIYKYIESLAEHSEDARLLMKVLDHVMMVYDSFIWLEKIKNLPLPLEHLGTVKGNAQVNVKSLVNSNDVKMKVTFLGSVFILSKEVNSNIVYQSHSLLKYIKKVFRVFDEWHIISSKPIFNGQKIIILEYLNERTDDEEEHQVCFINEDYFNAFMFCLARDVAFKENPPMHDPFDETSEESTEEVEQPDVERRTISNTPSRNTNRRGRRRNEESPSRNTNRPRSSVTPRRSRRSSSTSVVVNRVRRRSRSGSFAPTNRRRCSSTTPSRVNKARRMIFASGDGNAEASAASIENINENIGDNEER